MSNDEEELARLRARVAELESTPNEPVSPTVVTTPQKRNSFAGGFLGCLGVGAAIVVVLVVLMSIGRCSQNLATTNATGANSAGTTSQAATNSGASQAAVDGAAKWVYLSSKDAMNDAETKTACVTSTNEATLTFPYKDTNAQLCIRKGPKYGLDSYVALNGDGQILCDIEGCSVHLRFDKGGVQSFPAVSAADNSTNIIFLRRTPSLIEALKRSSKTVVELRFYQNGDQELEFDTTGLKWP